MVKACRLLHASSVRLLDAKDNFPERQAEHLLILIQLRQTLLQSASQNQPKQLKQTVTNDVRTTMPKS
ncbi:hypothetical protein T02_5205 [Trichinella nativa]|uniref:Uncharacterized protein n=2 Tax=Trichinella TaxID=6333 RepID=A0A0V1LDG3_9BILA|nr:hypothetical protein T12_4431 [Trichinella patagoniensis]KRZ57356.1 hypothetical protein T02_5205 [Trichinella nativa]